MTQTNGGVLILSAIVFFASAFVTKFLIPPYVRMLLRGNQVRRNFKGVAIPVGTGSCLAVVFAGCCFLYLLVVIPAFSQAERDFMGMILLAIGMSFLGMLDDTAGNREAGGFLGHLRKMLVDGELTTGLVKAAAGMGLAMAVVTWTEGFQLLDSLLVALAANWVNLLDVRPGRALKATLFYIGILFFLVPRYFSIPLLALAGIAAAYFPFDVKARTMMGDAGANFFGAIVGFVAARSFDWQVSLLVFLILLGLHIFTEFRSISGVIEQNPFLSWVDRMGQEEAR